MGKLVSADPTVIRTVSETLLALPYETWNFGDSVAFEGMLRASEVTGDDRYAISARAWARSWAARRRPFRRLDATAPGKAIVDLVRHYQDDDLLEAALDLAAYLRARPRIRGLYETWEHAPLMAPYGGEELSEQEAQLLDASPAGSFLDCLHFDPPFLTGLGALVGEDELMADGVEQALSYIEVLQQEKGDFAHFILEGQPGVYGLGWTRGQGWALLGMLDVIETLQETPKRRGLWSEAVERIGAATRALIDRMVASQRPDGHWDARLDDPDSGLESSTAAFMAEGFRRARHLVLAAADAPWVATVEAAERRARRAVLQSVDDTGALRDVSVAVMACTRDSHYSNVPRGFHVPWGQGPAVLALSIEDLDD